MAPDSQDYFTAISAGISAGRLTETPVRAALRDISEGHIVVGNLLEFSQSVDLEGVVRFVVAEHFQAGNQIGPYTIVRVDEDFMHCFGDIVEEDVPARTVHLWKFTNACRDREVVDLLNREQQGRAYTYFAHIYQLMARRHLSRSTYMGGCNVVYAEAGGKRPAALPYKFDNGRFSLYAHFVGEGRGDQAVHGCGDWVCGG